MRWLPIASQLFVLAAVPAPFPTTSVSANRKMENRYSGTVIHSMKRTDECVTAYAKPNPMSSHRICDLYA
jgi:hypothetical protein